MLSLCFVSGYFICVIFFVVVLCLWDGFTFIYRFRFIFLTDSYGLGWNVKHNLNLINLNKIKLFGAASGLNSSM
jgi:hypothetical protein